MAKFQYQPLAAKEAVEFFRRKGFAIGFDWRDVWQAEHAAAFTVAKATRLDILEDIRGAVAKAITQGVTFRDFKKNLAPVLQAKGWWGRQSMVDPKTGEQVRAQLGSDRRLRIIFDTNLRTAQAAGRWERIQRVRKRRPWLRYIAVLDERTRQQHRAWHGTVLPVDDSFWSTHYPPNGWRCRCIVQQLSDRDLKRFGHEPSRRPRAKTRPWRNRRTGEVLRVPEGIDPGFAHNVGKSRFRALTPPPDGGLPTSFPPGTALPPLPAARSAPASRLLPDNLGDDEYVRRFLAEFGAEPGKPKIFTDVVGESMAVGKDMFLTAGGEAKVTKGLRHTHMLLLADTIKVPDEIWWVWEEMKSKPGTYSLRRRYLARWELPSKRVSGVSVFEMGKDGWKGTTVFTPKAGRSVEAQDRYLAGQRIGTLAHRRK